MNIYEQIKTEIKQPYYIQNFSNEGQKICRLVSS